MVADDGLLAVVVASFAGLEAVRAEALCGLELLPVASLVASFAGLEAVRVEALCGLEPLRVASLDEPESVLVEDWGG